MPPSCYIGLSLLTMGCPFLNYAPPKKGGKNHGKSSTNTKPAKLVSMRVLAILMAERVGFEPTVA